MSDETYEGWANRETWAVALHINNDQGWQESVHGALRLGDLKASEAGEVIRASVDIHAAVSVDVLRNIGSLWRVDWDELGAAFLADCADARCYSDHNEDIRTKGSCDYCGSDVRDPS